MFARVFSVVALALCASASVLPRTGGGGSCNVGSLQCCNSLQNASSSGVTAIAAPLGIVLSGITGLVGLNCSPLTGIGAGGTSCSSQTACCTNNSFNGVIALGCTPINLNL